MLVLSDKKLIIDGRDKMVELELVDYNLYVFYCDGC